MTESQWLDNRTHALATFLARIPPRAYMGWNPPDQPDPFGPMLAFWHNSPVAYLSEMGRTPHVDLKLDLMQHAHALLHGRARAA